MLLPFNVISVLSEGISLYGFLDSLIPPSNDAHATVKIYASNGYNPNTGDLGNSNTGGRIRNVFAFDGADGFLGQSGGGDIHPGDSRVFKINQGGNQPALYMNIVAEEHAICIPVVGVAQPGGLRYGWVGDVFSGCGLANYYGNIVVDDSNNIPRCGWIGESISEISMCQYMTKLPTLPGF